MFPLLLIIHIPCAESLVHHQRGLLPQISSPVFLSFLSQICVTDLIRKCLQQQTHEETLFSHILVHLRQAPYLFEASSVWVQVKDTMMRRVGEREAA